MRARPGQGRMGRSTMMLQGAARCVSLSSAEPASSAVIWLRAWRRKSTRSWCRRAATTRGGTCRCCPRSP
ncbi:Uncharacterised protein [Bordetella pertussis]|nr:Uncharacterised protein [Bordetella pertussis]